MTVGIVLSKHGIGPFKGALCRLGLFVAGLLVVSAGRISAAPLPEVIAPDRFGQPTFDERWQAFDVGQDQVRPPRPHRWRTVLGHGGALSPDNRKGSDGSIYVDPDFPGIENGRLGEKPLGLQPFVFSRNRSVTIEARPTPDALKEKLFGKPYLSGVLTTRFSFAQRFGYFEVEAKLPVGKGLWPAFWMMPIRGQWPQNGELDIIEGLGVTNEIWCSVHSAALPGKQSSEKIKLGFDVSTDWHTYGVGWNAGELVWYVDHKAVRRIPTPADMKTEPMYLLLNLAVGGSWGGYPDASTKFPARLDIRRVTVWQFPS